MEFYKGQYLGSQKLVSGVTMTIGNFDGLHKGHRFLISELLEATPAGGPSVVLSFSPHPSHVVGKSPVPSLFSEEDRRDRLEELGVDIFVLQDFSPSFAALSAEDFLRQFLFPVFEPRTLILGHDFSFGKGGEGDYQLVKSLSQNWKTQVKQAQVFQLKGQTVSSTKIRDLVSRGQVAEASFFLERPFYVEGNVVHGEALGRTLGFPTANISHKQIAPGKGVYAGWAEWKGCFYKAVVNVGTRPTVSDSSQQTIECHLLNFSEDLYGEKLKFHFKEKIRDEKKFSGKVELEEQIAKDIKSAESVLNGEGNP